MKDPREAESPDLVAVDAFDLPDWLGLEEVTWQATSSLGGHRVSGALHGRSAVLVCDLLAGDLAYPRPALPDAWRSAAHQAWGLDEVLLVEAGGRLTLVLPGWRVTAEPALEAVRRLARAVGATASRYAVLLRC